MLQLFNWQRLQAPTSVKAQRKQSIHQTLLFGQVFNYHGIEVLYSGTLDPDLDQIFITSYTLDFSYVEK